MDNVVRIGIPKGSLADATVDLFDRAGFEVSVSSRSYFPSINDPELDAVMFRAQEMSRYVEKGVVDVGITGKDWILENDSDVVEVATLNYSKATSKPARWVLAVPNESKVQKVEDLAGGTIATELVNVTRKYFADRNIDIDIEFSWGATEVKARMLSGIVELTETGSSLRANNLRIMDEILESTAKLIANRQAWENSFKKEKIESLALLLLGAIEARHKVGLKMNVPRAALDEIASILPSEKSPTISPLADDEWCAIEVILDEITERNLVPRLKRAGATDLITYPLNKVIQ